MGLGAAVDHIHRIADGAVEGLIAKPLAHAVDGEVLGQADDLDGAAPQFLAVLLFRQRQQQPSLETVAEF